MAPNSVSSFKTSTVTPSPRRFLLLQLKRIGDTILTAPATGALRAAFPDAKQTLIVNEAAAGLAPAFPEVVDVWSHRPGRLNTGLWSRLLGRKFDVCLDFSGTDRSALMARCSGAPARVGYRKFAEAKSWRRKAYTHLCNASVRELHTVDFHLALIEELCGRTMEPEGDGFRVSGPPPSCGSGLGGAGGRYVVIHPGTARSEKYWPAERWASVIEYLQAHHELPCVATGSNEPEEREHLNQIRRHCPAEFSNLAGKLSLLELAAVIGNSTLALGVDSAAMHLAAVQKCSQIVLFGPTNPFHWRPRHENASVLVAGDKSLNVRGFCPNRKGSLMTDLSTELVCRAIDERLAATCRLS